MQLFCRYGELVAGNQVTTTRDPKPTSDRIVKLAERVLDGDIVLPEFQRKFVWKRSQIIQLLDSIYRNYPIGSLLVWESHEQLESKRSIADLVVAERSSAYPVNYLLDGQQRLSTVCGALHWSPKVPKSIWNLYFDLDDRKFHHADTLEKLPLRQIPLRLLSNPSTFFGHMAMVKNAEEDPIQATEMDRRARFLFDRFTDYQVPLVTLGNMTVKDVAPVFERINSTGTKLTIYDLMRAATWTKGFDLGAKLEGVQLQLEPKNYHTVDNKTLLRALGAAVGGDFSVSSINLLRDRPKDTLLAGVERLGSASMRAADFLSTEIGAPRAESLPYANQFAVLCEVFAQVPIPTTDQLAAIRRWFWRTTLTNYFGGWNSSQMSQDAKDVRAFASEGLADIPFSGTTPTASLWRARPFRSNSAASKMLAILLAHGGPQDLLNGAKLEPGKSLAWSNDKEYHHFFPQKYLDRLGIKEVNVLANIVMLSSASNIAILDKAPSVYLGAIISEIGREKLVERLASNLVPETALDAALSDDYATFLAARSALLHERLLDLTQLAEDQDQPSADELTDELGDDSDDGLTD